MNIPAHYGGHGARTQWAWALCDAPLIVYALAKFGLPDDPAGPNAAVDHLAGLLRDNGWPCAVSKSWGASAGRAARTTPAPSPTWPCSRRWPRSSAWRDGAGVPRRRRDAARLWDREPSRHPYMFYMGTDFRKLKVPFVWYDLLHVLDVLSRFPWLAGRPRLLDMLGVLKSKAGRRGPLHARVGLDGLEGLGVRAEAHPSRWLTLIAWRIIRRINGRTQLRPDLCRFSLPTEHSYPASYRHHSRDTTLPCFSYHC